MSRIQEQRARLRQERKSKGFFYLHEEMAAKTRSSLLTPYVYNQRPSRRQIPHEQKTTNMRAAKKIWLTITLLSLPAPALCSTVIAVVDGDTISIHDGYHLSTVRLACIDAPEIDQHPHGAKSRQSLKELLSIGSNITLSIHTKDRYGRSIAEVFTEKGNINQLMIKQGHGFVYQQYLSKCNGSRYLSLERQAQILGLGVWSTSPTGIQRPWDYRRSKRSVSSSFKRKYRCKEIASWNKAQQLLKQGHTYLDRDRDGEACESLR